MKKQTKSRFWPIYRIVTGVFLLLIIGFFLFFYDFMASYELSQPIHAAEVYMRSLTREKLQTLYYEDIGTNSASVLESPERISDLYSRTAWAVQGDFSVHQDYTASSDGKWQFTIAKGDIPIASVTVASTLDGKYGFSVCRVESASAITEYLQLDTIDYTIVVPKDSIVTVNGTVLHEEFISDLEADYGFAHPLEKQISIACQAYTIADMLSVPEIHCEWNGAVCTGEWLDGKWQFAYPDTELKTYTVYAPADATVTANGIRLTEEYRIQSDVPYVYSVYDATDGTLPVQSMYELSGLLHMPDIAVTMEGKPISGTVNGETFYYPYPEELLYTQIVYVPAGSVLRVNGNTVNGDHLKGREHAYPDLFSGSDISVYMDTYTLSGLYKISDDLEIIWNGVPLRARATEEGRVVSYRAVYPDPQNEEIRTLATAFCKDYFAYTAGGYKDTEENLNRVLQYLMPKSTLFNRLLRSKESIGFVTPVTKQVFHTLTLDTVEALNDTTLVCSVTYDIEQWTYSVQRMYSGKLWLSFQKQEQDWVLTHMLTDIK